MVKKRTPLELEAEPISEQVMGMLPEGFYGSDERVLTKDRYCWLVRLTIDDRYRQTPFLTRRSSGEAIEVLPRSAIGQTEEEAWANLGFALLRVDPAVHKQPDYPCGAVGCPNKAVLFIAYYEHRNSCFRHAGFDVFEKPSEDDFFHFEAVLRDPDAKPDSPLGQAYGMVDHFARIGRDAVHRATLALAEVDTLKRAAEARLAIMKPAEPIDAEEATEPRKRTRNGKSRR